MSECGGLLWEATRTVGWETTRTVGVYQDSGVGGYQDRGVGVYQVRVVGGYQDCAVGVVNRTCSKCISGSGRAAPCQWFIIFMDGISRSSQGPNKILK